MMRGLSAIEKVAAPKAGARTLNRVAQQTKTRAVRDIKDAMGLSNQRAVRKALRIEKATPRYLVSSLTASGYRIPLIHFKASQTRTGVAHTAYGSRKVRQHAFIATMPGGGKHVFLRRTKKRLKILKQFGGRIPDAMAEDKVMNTLKTFASQKLEERFAHELKYEVERVLSNANR